MKRRKHIKSDSKYAYKMLNAVTIKIFFAWHIFKNIIK